MREEGRAAARARLQEREAARPDLERDPDPEEPDRRNLANEDDPEEDHGQDAGAGEENEVRAEDTGDRAARADVRNARVTRVAEPERDRRLERRGREPGQEVPDEEAHAAERVFDVVPEDPEKEHVAEDVLPACVHEHPGEDALVPGQRMDDEVDGHVARAADGARVVAVLEDVDVDARLRELPEPDDEVRDDDPDRDDRERLGRDVVAEWQHRLRGGERLADAVGDSLQLERCAGDVLQ